MKIDGYKLLESNNVFTFDTSYETTNNVRHIRHIGKRVGEGREHSEDPVQNGENRKNPFFRKGMAQRVTAADYQHK